MAKTDPTAGFSFARGTMPDASGPAQPSSPLDPRSVNPKPMASHAVAAPALSKSTKAITRPVTRKVSR
jgi:hypothetical protein